MTAPVIPPEPSLSEELAAVQADTGWHCWHSDTGDCHATTCKCPLGGSGTTVEAPTPGLLRHAIAAEVHQWHVTGWAA
jgi:hypothetical protein